MHNRQGGAAHVNIFFLLFALILFIGGVFFLYTMLAEKGDVEDALAEQRATVATLETRDLIYQHNIEDLTDVLGFSTVLEMDGDTPTYKSGTYAGQARLGEDYYASEVLRGVALPSEYQRIVKQGLEKLGADTGATTLQAATAAINARTTKLQESIAAAETRMTEALAAKRQADAKVSEAKGAHATEVAEVLSTMEQGVQQFEQQSLTNAKTIADAHGNLRRRQQDLHQEVQDHVQDRKRLQAINARYSNHKSALEAVLSQRNPPDAVDGLVVAADDKVGRGFIDLSRRDGLITGTVFRITNPGSNQVKAYGTVVSVGDERSEIAVHGVVDRFDPVAGGDELSNDRFTPGMRRTIHLMGAFADPWDRTSITRILTELGHDVVKRFDAGVDLVILGDDLSRQSIAETEAFQDASTLGVEFAPVAKIRDLLILSR